VIAAHEFDGCDSGAAPDEAQSWGKIAAEAPTVKACADAAIAFPLLVATVFKVSFSNPLQFLK
jgi:deoxyhypusine synthase